MFFNFFIRHSYSSFCLCVCIYLNPVFLWGPLVALSNCLYHYWLEMAQMGVYNNNNNNNKHIYFSFLINLIELM